MTIHYDESQESLVRRLLENKELVIGLDVAEGKDKSVEVTYCIRHKDAILTTEILRIKEVQMKRIKYLFINIGKIIAFPFLLTWNSLRCYWKIFTESTEEAEEQERRMLHDTNIFGR